MARKQKWSVEISGEVHTVEYTPRTLLSKAKIKIDENIYPLYSAKLFGESQDAFRLGGEMAIIAVGRNKKAKLVVCGEEIKEN